MNAGGALLMAARPVSMAPSGAAWSRARWLACCLGVLLIGLAIKLPEVLLPIGPDQGTYDYVAERILDGGLPYVDAWDNKPPATYYVHAAVLAVVPRAARWAGTCLPGIPQTCGYLASQVADIVWTAASALVILAIARELGFSPVGSLASMLLFSAFVNLSQLSKEGSTPEKQLLLPMGLAYLATLRMRQGGVRWPLVVGVCAGVAFLFKQTAVSIPLALAAWAIWTRGPDWRRYGLVAPGMALPLAAVALYFAARGALGDVWAATFAYNFAQAGATPWRIPYGLLAGSWHVFSNSSALLWLLGVGGALLVRTARARLLVCWALADALSLCLGGSKFAQVYYVQLVPSLALLGGLAVAVGWPATRDRRLARLYAGLVVASVFVLSNQFQMSVALRAWNDRFPGRASVSFEQMLATRFGPNERGGRAEPLFIWGDNSELYLWAEARAPGRFFHVVPLSRQYAPQGLGQRRAELLQALRSAPPAIVAIDPATARDDPDGRQGLNLSSFPELVELLQAGYQPLTDIGGGWQAYRRVGRRS